MHLCERSTEGRAFISWPERYMPDIVSIKLVYLLNVNCTELIPFIVDAFIKNAMMQKELKLQLFIPFVN